MSTTRFDRPPLARPLRILMVDDVAEDAELNLRELTRAGLEVSSDVVARREEFSVRLSAHDYDLVLADFHLPDWNGYEVLEILRQQRRHIPLILVTGSIGEEVVAECIRRGAADYVLKDHLVRLPIAVRRVLAEKTDRKSVV